MISKLVLSSFLALSCIGLSAAEAKILKVYRNTNAQTTTANDEEKIASLTSSGTNSISFTIPAKEVVAITYSAECQNSSSSGWVSIAILVDGVAIAPTAGTDDAFCTATPWVTASTTVGAKFNAGTHTVQVKFVGVGTTVRLDDSSLVIFD